MPGGCLPSRHAVSESLGNSRAAHPTTDLCSPCPLLLLLSGQAQRHGCLWHPLPFLIGPRLIGPTTSVSLFLPLTGGQGPSAVASVMTTSRWEVSRVGLSGLNAGSAQQG